MDRKPGAWSIPWQSALFIGVFSWLALIAGRSALGADLLSYDEFVAMAAKVAPKVNLFREVWETHPQAEFFGGTSRDFLYWLKRELLRGARTRADVEQNKKRLLELQVVDVREFIIGESDAAIVSNEDLRVDSTRFSVKRLDRVDPRRLDPESEHGKSERDQGFIPVEKIRLSSRGIVPSPGLGDGVREILSGKQVS